MRSWKTTILPVPEYNPLDDEGPEWAEWMRRFAADDDASDLSGEFEAIDAVDAESAADFDDGDDDEETYSQVPPPHERSWVHPAEAAAAARAAAADHPGDPAQGIEPGQPGTRQPNKQHSDISQLRVRTTTTTRSGSRPVGSRQAIFALATTALVGVLVLGGIRLIADGERAADAQDSLGVVSSSAISSIGNQVAGPANLEWTDAARARVAPGLARIEAVSGGTTIQGAGIALDGNGNILTSAVLIEGASHILVWTCEGRFSASVVGLDDLTDVAIIRIDASIEAPDMATDQQVQAGQYALIAEVDDDTAVRIGRVKKVRDNAEVAPGLEVHGLLETTLAPNTTLPGAAIFDDLGVVIGMATGQVADSDKVAAHVLPIDLADRVANEILNFGEANHAWLGIYGVDGPQGAFVESIVAGGPAEQGGIRTGDLISGVDGMPVTSMDDLVSALRGFAPGDDVSVQFSRDLETHSLVVRLGAVAD